MVRTRMDLADGSPNEQVRDLYNRAFSEFGAQCLWSWAPVAEPAPRHARVIARALKAEGNRAAYELAWQIEEACDAADRTST